MLPFILTIRDESDRSLVEDVYLKYGRKIYCIAGNYLKDDREIEDCVQDVFVMLIDHLEEYRVWQEKHQINFLVKCCRCIAINKYKVTAKRHRKESVEQKKTGTWKSRIRTRMWQNPSSVKKHKGEYTN